MQPGGTQVVCRPQRGEGPDGSVRGTFVKFLHCADVHLDSPMRNLDVYEGAPSALLKGATRRAFERTVDLALDEQVSFVIIAGDLVDGNRDDWATAMFLQNELHRLRQGEIPVFIVYGNHDSVNEITRRLKPPDNVHVFSASHAETKILPDIGVALHGRSYESRVAKENLAVNYPAPTVGMLNIGVLHTSLDGRPGHAPYAPCTAKDLASAGYSYWALGHVHQREHIHLDDVHIVFPGTLQGRDVGETGSKGAMLVDFEGQDIVEVEHRDLACVRWETLEPDLDDVEHIDEVCERVAFDLRELRGSSTAELLAVRVVLNTSTSIAGTWLRDHDRYDAELRAVGDDTLWIEKIKLAPRLDSEGEVSGGAIDAVREALTALRSGNRDEGDDSIESLLGPVRREFHKARRYAAQFGDEPLELTPTQELLDQVEALLVAELTGDS